MHYAIPHVATSFKALGSPYRLIWHPVFLIARYRSTGTLAGVCLQSDNNIFSRFLTLAGLAPR
jgi:hypothetical protein